MPCRRQLALPAAVCALATACSSPRPYRDAAAGPDAGSDASDAARAESGDVVRADTGDATVREVGSDVTDDVVSDTGSDAPDEVIPEAGGCDVEAFDAATQPLRVTASLTPRPAGRNTLAFDARNRVYLSILAGSPITALFLSEDGAPIGNAFSISTADEASFSGWPVVSFGGPPSDPVFLVTYLDVVGNAQIKYARMVRYQPGAAPSVSAPSLIADVQGEWYASEKAQSIWDGAEFVVATRIGGGAYPQPWLHHVDTSGNVSAGQLLGDGMDFEGSPSIACAPGSVCLATGFANGVPLGAQGVVYARRFDPATLQPVGPVVYLDDHTSRMDDPVAVFDARVGVFTVAWWQAQYAAFRTVGTDGTLGAPGPMFGPGAGDIALSYNPATQTTLLVTKWSPPPNNTGADLYAVELQPGIGFTAPVLLTQWDGSWPEYTEGIAFDAAGARWFVIAVESDGGRAAMIQGTPAPRGCATSP